VGILLCAVVLCAWTQTTDKATAVARIESLQKRVGEIDARQVELKTRYADQLTERDKLRRYHRAIVIALEKVEKSLEGYVRETETLSIESATSTEEIRWLTERIKEVDLGATDKVALTQDAWLEMIANQELGATDTVKVEGDVK
jgi:chromosome segregation ATPase